MVFILFVFITTAKAQSEIALVNKPAIAGGMGNYEYLHVGLNIPFKHSAYFETALGIKPWGFDERYMMVYMCLGGRFLKEKKVRKLKPFLHLKLVCWDFSNRYNHFIFLGINPEFRLSYTVTERMRLCGNIGGIYNAMLYYKRKTYEEVGWPKEWQPSFSIQMLYSFR